jgi:Na+/proline symporter
MNHDHRSRSGEDSREHTRARLAYILVIAYIVLLFLAILIPLALFAFTPRDFDPETLVPALVLVLGGLASAVVRVVKHYFSGENDD